MQLYLWYTPLRCMLNLHDILSLLYYHTHTCRKDGLSTCNAIPLSARAKIWNFNWVASADCYEYVNEQNEVIEVRQNLVSV